MFLIVFCVWKVFTSCRITKRQKKFIGLFFNCESVTKLAKCWSDLIFAFNRSGSKVEPGRRRKISWKGERNSLTIVELGKYTVSFSGIFFVNFTGRKSWVKIDFDTTHAKLLKCSSIWSKKKFTQRKRLNGPEHLRNKMNGNGDENIQEQTES